MATVSGFLPSTNGLRFVNSWPDEPDIIVTVPGLGRIPVGNASNGLCGGMTFTVRDVFEAKLPPLPDGQPAEGSPLFTYIVHRLVDSFEIPDGVLKYFAWMNTPDHDTHVLWFVMHRGVAWRTIVEEWPKIQADIDGQHLSPLGLVTVRSSDPADLGKNHQVLAYGYDLAGDDLTIHLYDPNTDIAVADNVTLRMSIADPTQQTEITHNVGIAEPIRGFFRASYTFSDPAALT